VGISAKKGDLFSIELEQSYCLGIVADKWNDELYIVIFREKFDRPIDSEQIDIAVLTPVLASSSLEAKIWHGHWPIIKRNYETINIMKPIYKVGVNGELIAESFDRKKRKLIDKVTEEKLRFRKGVAPVRLEKAIKAYHGIGEWDPIYDQLSYSYVKDSNEIVKW